MNVSKSRPFSDRSLPGGPASCGIGRCVLLMAVAMLACGVVPARAAADADSPHHEIWDATTIDVHDQLRPLDGMWEHVPWQRLDQPPSFEGAGRVRVPGTLSSGAYRTTFSVTADPGAQTRRVILHFGAVGYHCRVLVNGQSLGTHLGGFTPFEFDVTEQVRRGENELVVLVLGRLGTLLNPEAGEAFGAEETFDESSLPVARRANKSIISFGYFLREGIRQSVHVREVPLLRLADVTLTTSFRDKRIHADVHLQNQTGQIRPVTVRLDVLPYDIASGTIGSDPVLSVQHRARTAPGQGKVTLTRDWRDPDLWMPGDPHLYVARVRLMDARTRDTLDERHVRFGFREVWVDGRKIIINGMPMRAFTYGTLDTEIGVAGLRKMFEQRMALGINMIRPSTMPPPPHFALLADEMGMTLIGESSLTFNRNHAYEQPAFWSHFQRMWRERVARDKNHPSILLWSLANEVMLTSPGKPIGEHFYQSYRDLKQLDPTRPIMQEGDGDLRDNMPDSRGFPIDIINLHLYDVHPTKNPLWATEFPPVAWAVEDITEAREVPGGLKYGIGVPDRNRPWFIGEFGPAVAIAYPDHFAFWTGPAAYRDLFNVAEPLVRGVGETMALQIQAFRDMDMAGMDPWDVAQNPYMAPYLKPAMEPVTVFSRDRIAHWIGGETARRPIVVLNDSFDARQLTLVVTLTQDGRQLDRQREAMTLRPGERHDMAWSLRLPEMRQATGCEFKVELFDDQRQLVSGFTENWKLFPREQPSPGWRAQRVRLIGDSRELGEIARWSGLAVQAPSALRDLDAAGVRLVLVDPSVFAALGDQAVALLERYIEGGGVVMSLDVDALSLAGLEVNAHLESDSTRVFLQRSHPLTRGTTEDDWQFWHPDHYVSRGNYVVPFDPAFELPLITSGRGGLRFSPLIVARHGRGALIASRLQLNEAVPTEPVARRLLNNVMAYADSLPEADDAAADRKLVLICPPGEQAAWAARLDAARVPLESQPDQLDPAAHVVLLTGDAEPSAAQIEALGQFVRRGGTLWVHRLTPQTSYLETLASWKGRPLSLRPPRMWLQQFEIDPSRLDHRLLDGISDYHTCWAVFAWTYGNNYTVRTTAIADFVLEAADPEGEVLLSEPEWVGQWDVTSSASGTLSQKILRELGTHERNESPGVGMALYPLGQGSILIDQLRWDTVMQDAESQSHDKALYLFGTLWKNMDRQ